MDHVTPCKGGALFSEETILFTPLPQATSTVDKRPDLLPQPEIMMEPDRNSPDIKNAYLSDGLSVINELRQKLDSIGLNKTANNCFNSVPEGMNQKNQQINNWKSVTSLINRSESHKGVEQKNKTSALHAVQSLTDLNQVYSDRPTLSRCISADDSLPTSEMSLSNYRPANISLPVIPGSDVNLSHNLVNLSLPSKTNDKSKSTGLELPSFTPLPLVSDEIRKNTSKLDVLCNVEDSERNTAREKALKIINTLDLVPAKEPPNSSNSSIQSLQHKSFDPMTPDKEDVSGFSQLMNKSDFQKDESWCNANYGLPIKPGDESLSFLSASQVSLDFMPPDDSLLRELGPAYPPKYINSQASELNFSTLSDSSYRQLQPQETPKNSVTYVKANRMRESSRNVKELFSELDSSICSSIVTGDLDEYLKDKNLTGAANPGRSTPDGLSTPMDDGSPDSVLRVSDIAKALQGVSINATPNSLAKRVMELSDRPSAEKSLQGYNDCERCFYEKTVVYGGIVHVDLHSESNSPQTLWTFQDLNPTLIRAVIKSTVFPVKVLLFPLVRKNILIKVQEVEFDRNDRYFARLHIINLSVENPQVNVIGASELDFGLVPECGVVRLPLKLRCNNTNVLVICPKFELEESSPFCVEFDEDNEEEIHLPPNQEITIKIVIKPTMGFCKDLDKVKCVEDQLKLCLSPMLGSETLYQVPLRASIFHCRLQIQDCMLEQPICPGEERQVHLKNSSPCSVTMKLKTTGRFNLSFNSLVLKPYEVSAVKISYFPLPDKDIAEGELVLSIVPGDLDHFIKLKGKGSQADFSFNSARESSSRSSSALGSVNSTMTMNSSVEPEGSLQLECTSVFLVWPSIGLGNSSTIKSCYIRSKGSYKEKLLIEINDPSNSFYLVTNERESKKSEVVVLNPHERKKISVEFAPKLLGQLKAQIIIRRVKTKSDADSKQVVLYGFGGCGNLRALNIVMDLVTREFKLSLQSNFSQQFSLQNWGDGVAFFSLSQKKLEGMHLMVNPLHGLIGPGEIRTVNLTLQADSSGSDYAFFQQLLAKDKSTDIVLSSLTIIYGDESTRLRLARLFRKYKNQPQFQKSPQVTSALKSLSELFPVNKQKMEAVSSLKDPLTSLYDLFNEGIQELTIDVITPRKTIEDANLEVTQQFVNFPEHSQLDETEYTTFFDTTNHPSHLTFN